MKSFGDLQRETRAIQFDFLIADLATGNTFLDVARTTKDDATRTRNIDNARTAYETVARLSTRLIMSAEQDAEFQHKLAALAERLRSF